MSSPPFLLSFYKYPLDNLCTHIYNENVKGNSNHERGVNMVVNEFKIGDKIRIYGWTGTVTDIDHVIKHDDGAHCTYLKVDFDEPEVVGYQYHGGWFGGKDDVVAYGHIDQ